MRAFEFLTEALSPAAVDATTNRFGEKLMNRLATDRRGKQYTDPKKFIEWVANDIDPTPNSTFTKWIIATYANSGIRFVEDLSKLTEPLSRFARLVQAKKIPLENRDINKFKDLNSFLKLMDQYKEVKTTNELKSEEEKNLFDTGQVELYKDTGAIKIVIPKTELAAKYYGRGTQWCTAGDKDNAFDEYNEEGPLYVIIFRKGTKWQFHFATAQFMDEHDEPLDPKLVRPISDLFPEELWEEALTVFEDTQPDDDYSPFVLRYIKNPSDDLMKLSVEYSPESIKVIKNPSEELKLLAVTNNGRAIQYIKNPTEEMKLVAVEQDGFAIEYIKNPTEQVQLAAVKQRPKAIQYIKNPTKEVRLAARRPGKMWL